MWNGSADGQDQFVIDVLGGMRGGFFLDSGASDGLFGNNTIRLEADLGWNGICVEPNPRFFAELLKNRRCHCVSCCLYDREGEVEFIDAEVLGGILDEYHPSLLEQARWAYGVEVDEHGRPATVSRPARTIESVLRDFDAPPVIDYWSLDTEGSELAILRSFPFDRYSVRVLTVEHNWLPAREEIRAFLEARGYRRVRELRVDDCYVRNDLEAPQQSWRSRSWQRVR